jgi:hypothetical protein
VPQLKTPVSNVDLPVSYSIHGISLVETMFWARAGILAGFFVHLTDLWNRQSLTPARPWLAFKQDGGHHEFSNGVRRLYPGYKKFIYLHCHSA